MKRSVISWIFITTLTLILAIAKLYGAITLPWFWVLSPLWVPFALLISLSIIAIIIAFIMNVLFVD
ncbi:MAG: hypothetical protein WDA65_08715 [Christensenellales bacterium]